MSLKYESSSGPLHISAKQLFLNWELYRSVQVWRDAIWVPGNESQSQNLALTVLYDPRSLDSAGWSYAPRTRPTVVYLRVWEISAITVSW